MSTLVIDLDTATDEALASLARARGTTPADLVAELVASYVNVQDAGGTLAPPAADQPRDTPNGADHPDDQDEYRAPPDALDALVGSISADPVDDIDEVIYGR